ncbi:ATP-grasp domain-containing protein [Streptomyces chartreusis]|uniref:ATP-grasp domain-containing protein n=1 Tax=Streptomyces chartreusis TaxID=1969 RepID=UPI00123D23BD|nr:ATP-grasp domain-containing protein [Streptomyces chartreusis]QEV67127.1 ATP-grasp domain-containing protein [Streptomyces chartreusis]GGX06316.1 argininosuccinate lyase [Streptomyces chartreusis]
MSEHGERELLLVGVGMMGRPYVAAARRLGLRVRAIEARDWAGAIEDLVDAVEPSGGRYGSLDELWAETVHAAALESRPDGILAFTESHVLGAAMAQDRFALPGPSLQAAVVSRNKALQRGRFRAHGIGQPEYLLTDDLPASAEWAGARLPVVVKPLSSAGSAGVELVADAAAFDDAAHRRAAERPLLVESALEGPEYSWEALVRDGEIWFANLTAKTTTGPPRFIELAHRVAAPLPAADAERVAELGRSVLTAIGMRTGIVHLEFRLTSAGPAVMEVAVRTPGDHIMELCSLAYGIDWHEMVVRLAVGAELPPPPQGPVRHAASLFLVSDPGEVIALDGLDEVREHPAVVDAAFRVAVGDTVGPASSSLQRTAYAVLAADSPQELEEAIEFTRRTLSIKTVPAATEE